jgi:succinyl-CoA synthetase beta subunit
LGSVPQAAEVGQVIFNFINNHISNVSELKPPESRNGNKNRKETYYPRLVVRLAGSELEAARQELAALKTQSYAPIIVENLDEAVAEAVKLAKIGADKRLKLA